MPPLHIRRFTGFYLSIQWNRLLEGYFALMAVGFLLHLVSAGCSRYWEHPPSVGCSSFLARSFLIYLVIQVRAAIFSRLYTSSFK